MKRNLYVILPLLFLFSIASGNSGNPGIMKVHCKFDGIPGAMQLYLYEFIGCGFRPLQSAPGDSTNQFEFILMKNATRYYYVGFNMNDVKPFLAGQEDSIHIRGTFNSLRDAVIENSPLNTSYKEVKARLDMFTAKHGGYITELSRKETSPGRKDSIYQEMTRIDVDKKNFLDACKKLDPVVYNYVALNTYLSYQKSNKKYKDEIDYYVNGSFQFVNLKDPVFERMPAIYETSKNIITTLLSVGVDTASQRNYVQQMLDRAEPGSRAHAYLLGGIMTAYKQRNKDFYVQYAKQFISLYSQVFGEPVENLAIEVAKIQGSMPGALAPDFTLPTPDGKELSLSSLRGKYVLIDFWASWCGPCRMENPNVVKLYQKYKDKGFDILGVSLDQDKSRWIGAISQDGLIWNHVSDLKRWQSYPAALYGVSSIPYTVLLDKEGKIVATQLRGAGLEAKLKEIFGE